MTTHVTSLPQLMSLYRRNNRSSESCSAIAVVVPVALEYEKPGSKEGSPAHITSADSRLVEPSLRQFCCSYWYLSSVQDLAAQSGWEQRKSRVGMGASRVVEWFGSSSLRQQELQEQLFWRQFEHSWRGMMVCSAGVATGPGCDLIGPNWWKFGAGGKTGSKSRYSQTILLFFKAD